MATLRINRSATSASWPPNTTMIHDLVSRDATRQPEPQSARVVGIFFTIITAGICTSLLTHRVSKTRSWRRLSYIRWLVISQYVGAFIYTLIAAVLQYGYDPNINNRSCSGAAIICVVVYGLIKLFYLFLADRLHVVRSSTKSRTRSRLFIFHTVGITVGINIMIILFSILRIDENHDGQCVIGVSRYIMLTGVSVDVLLNVYLTAFFLYYLSKSFSLRTTRGIRHPHNLIASDGRASKLGEEIRGLAKRTIIGLGISLAATIANLVATMVMNGEVYWLCFLTCKADILIGIIVLHWITSGRRHGQNHNSNYYSSSHGDHCYPSSGGGGSGRPPQALIAMDATLPTKPSASHEAHLRLNRRGLGAAAHDLNIDDDDDDDIPAITTIATGPRVVSGKALPQTPTPALTPALHPGSPVTSANSTDIHDRDSDDEALVIQRI